MSSSVDVGVHTPQPKEGQVILRKSTVKDVPTIARIINGYAGQGQMLPRSHHKIYQCLRDFIVAEVQGVVVGCGALHVVWEDLAEVRSLAIVSDWRGKGLGQRMVNYLLAEAQELGLTHVFALTYQQGFFERMGFHVVPHESLPHKIWGDCLDCPKFPNCDEIAVAIDLDAAQ